MIVTEETKANAQAVYDYIIVNPERHRQQDWIKMPDLTAYESIRMANKGLSEENICGTTMCVAGTNDFLKRGYVSWGVSARAAVDFGLEDGEAEDLFYCMDKDLALDMVLAIAQGDADKFEQLAATDYV